jgi:hypothetical protein
LFYFKRSKLVFKRIAGCKPTIYCSAIFAVFRCATALGRKAQLWLGNSPVPEVDRHKLYDFITKHKPYSIGW